MKLSATNIGENKALIFIIFLSVLLEIISIITNYKPEWIYIFLISIVGEAITSIIIATIGFMIFIALLILADHLIEFKKVDIKYIKSAYESIRNIYVIITFILSIIIYTIFDFSGIIEKLYGNDINSLIIILEKFSLIYFILISTIFNIYIIKILIDELIE